MPRKTSPRTVPLPYCQLIDLLKETEGLEKGKVLSTHERQGIGTDTRSISFDKGEGHSDDQEIHDDQVIGRTVLSVYLKEPDSSRGWAFLFYRSL
jgi:hypothetical protein